MNKLVTFTGPSGVGKSFVVSEMIRRYPGQFAEAVSTTSRMPRPMEIDGEHYWFTTRPEFEDLRQAGDLLEHVVYNENYYGVEKQEVENKLDNGHCLIVVEPAGAKQIRERWDGPLVQIYLTAASESVLKERMAMRGDSPDAIEERLTHDRAYFSERRNFVEWDHVLESGDIDDLTIVLHKIIAG